MPSAEGWLADKIRAKYGSIDDAGPTKLLHDAGYVLREDWHWDPKPGVTDYPDMTQDEYEAMLFLLQEWDFGGLILKRY